MAWVCPKCGSHYSGSEFSRQDIFKCKCGFLVHISMFRTVEDFLNLCLNEEEKRKALEIQQEAWFLCHMILDRHCPEETILEAQNQLRGMALRYFPDKAQTFDMIYGARFKRLREQFRSENSE